MGLGVKSAAVERTRLEQVRISRPGFRHQELERDATKAAAVTQILHVPLSRAVKGN
jgi:hypothetical protein